MKKPIRPIDPELAEFEAALLRSIGQARSGEVGARHTPEMPPSDARGVQAVPMIGRRGRVYEVLNRKRALTLPMVWRLHVGLGIPAESLIRPPGTTV